MKIIKYENGMDVDVEFLDEYHYVKEHTTYNNFKLGKIKNPYHKSVFGVGYVGEGNYKTKENGKFTIFYQQWKNMLLRCYVKADRHLPYEDAKVCDEWLNFQTFAKWYDEHYYEVDERLHIDKDIKIKDLEKDMEYFRASGSMPLVSKIVEVNGKKYLDGGIADSIPLQKAKELGYDRIIVILH